MIRDAALMLLFASFLVCHCVAADDLRIGVFDQGATKGVGATVDRLVKELNTHGYKAEAVADFRKLTLLQYDIIFLCDMQSPGRVRDGWRGGLTKYVRNGGSVLQTWHHHVLGEVGVGVKRIYDSRGMHIVPGHPAVEGLKDFNAHYKDHIIERVGKGATILIKNDAGQPVAVAGMIGKGKVISTGLSLGIPNGRNARWPRGAEEKVLKSFLAWLKPDVSRTERLTRALKSPALLVTPSEILTAAGFPATFQVRVAPGEKGGTVELTCPDAEVKGEPPLRLADGPGGTLCRYKLVVKTEKGKSSEKEMLVRAKIDGEIFEETVKVTSVYGGGAPPNERRGVWLHVNMDRQPKDVMPELKKLGINFAVLRIAGGMAAFYSGSKVQPDIMDPLAPKGDWLADAVKYAHENGIEMHPYVNCCIVSGRASEETLQKLRDAGRLQMGPDGKEIEWFCPSQEVNLKHMEAVMVEIATKYDVDGVQYDFIRYPNARGCFCPKCRALFEKETGKAVEDWPKDVLPDGARYAEWIEFRCTRISNLVERTSNHIRREAPKVKISAAVFRNWPDCRVNNGQDWARWCKEGWLDFVCPMNYTLDPKAFAAAAAAHREAVPEGFPIVEGIGIRAGSGAMNDPAQLALHIALARKNGAAGWVGFCYTPKQTSELIGPLREWLGVK
ncbi:MAG: family 10 glycosylhydrolase [Planctomycetes bacterium]|nr:family 10 glycosylhydrolase [Planctomycetota bacterium]